MKVRFAVTFALLLSLAAFTSPAARAGTPAGPMSQMTPAVAPAATPDWMVAPCAANPTASSPLTLPGSKPTPVDTTICGSCSTPACRGVTYNSFCSAHYPSSCVAALGGECSDGVPQCQCWQLGQPYP